MKKRHIHVSLDFDVEVDESGKPITEVAPHFQERVNAQQSLLKAIMGNEQFLNRYLSWEIANLLDGMGTEDWETAMIGEVTSMQSNDVFAPFIATLNPAAKAFFEDAEEAGLFFENVETIIDCFAIRTTASSITVGQA